MLWFCPSPLPPRAHEHVARHTPFQLFCSRATVLRAVKRFKFSQSYALPKGFRFYSWTLLVCSNPFLQSHPLHHFALPPPSCVFIESRRAGKTAASIEHSISDQPVKSAVCGTLSSHAPNDSAHTKTITLLSFLGIIKHMV